MPAFFILIISLLEVLVLLGHFVIYLYLGDIFFINDSHAHLLFGMAFIVLSFSFLIAQVSTHKFNNIFSRFFYKLAASWMGLFVYLMFSAVIWSLFGLLVGQIFFGLSLLIFIYGLISGTNLEVTKLAIFLPHLPQSWQGRSIVFLADTHLGQIRGSRFLQKVINKINQFDPKIILHGGDFYDGVKTDVQKLANLLGQNGQKNYKIYFVTGNHESFDNSKIYTEPLRLAGIRLLNNEVDEFEGLQIIGVDYEATEKEKDYEKVLESLNIDKNKPSILIKHTPLHLEIPAKFHINLVLSGHSHRGQIWPFRYVTRAIFKGFDYGLKKLGTMNVYTTSGAGTWGPPLRVFTKSEIVVIELNNEH